MQYSKEYQCFDLYRENWSSLSHKWFKHRFDCRIWIFMYLFTKGCVLVQTPDVVWKCLLSGVQFFSSLILKVASVILHLVTALLYQSCLRYPVIAVIRLGDLLFGLNFRKFELQKMCKDTSKVEVDLTLNDQTIEASVASINRQNIAVYL